MKGTAYLLQATLISLWWIGLLWSPTFYAAFQFPGIGPDAFKAFLLPDLVILGLLSIVRAYTHKKQLDYVILGGFAFATLYCINATILTGGGLLSTTIMVLGLCYNLFLIADRQVFRNSTSSNLWLNGLKTGFQILCVWLLTLFVFPALLLHSFGTPTVRVGPTAILSIILFIGFSGLGLYSAYTMVKLGEGTPLPIDQTQKLVTKGPYQYVRNPMAIAGIGQGLAISLLFRSVPILLYALIGAVLWQFVVRPLEENDMEERFGEPYLDYKKRVKCWIPIFRS
ncbi:MAG: isoprenylcysteine carboxylmethyltransferase family protein [Bacteroidota bacterium]